VCTVGYRWTPQMRALVIAAIAAVSAELTSADALELIGQAGVLGEWELTANLAATGAKQEFGGPIVLKHIALCSVDGPETRTGEMRLQILSASRVRATLSIDGTACTFRGTKSDAYIGVMSCRDRRDAPLRLWIK
jgi:hypothetical protein